MKILVESPWGLILGAILAGARLFYPALEISAEFRDQGYVPERTHAGFLVGVRLRLFLVPVHRAPVGDRAGEGVQPVVSAHVP